MASPQCLIRIRLAIVPFLGALALACNAAVEPASEDPGGAAGGAETSDLGAGGRPAPTGDVAPGDVAPRVDGEETPAPAPEEEVPPPEEEPPPDLPIFTDDHAALGLPDLWSSSISLVDVDRDGFPDLLVGGKASLGTPTEVMMNEDGAAFSPLGLAGRLVGEVALQPEVHSTSAVDLNGDELPDLLLGGYFEGRLQVLWNRGNLHFEPQDLWSSDVHPGTRLASVETADLDGDGVLDLYLGLKFPDSGLCPTCTTHYNAVLRGLGFEGFVDATELLPEILPCGSGQTFANARIPRRALGLPDAFYVANDITPDCLWTQDPAAWPKGFEPYPDPAGVLAKGTFSMGLDWDYAPDTGEVLVVVPNVGLQVAFGLEEEALADRSALFPDPGLDYFYWAPAFLDADNDGDRDLVVAAGIPSSVPSVNLVFAQRLPHKKVALENRLFYYERQPDGSFVDRSDEAGAPFQNDSGDWYGLARGDLDRDGCVDLVATMKEIATSFPFDPIDAEDYLPENDMPAMSGPGARVFVNSCREVRNHWIGFDLPDRPGLLLALERSDGTTVYDSIRGLSGVGSRSGGGTLHFGLGEELLPVRATVFDEAGLVLAVREDLVLDAYHEVDVE